MRRRSAARAGARRAERGNSAFSGRQTTRLSAPQIRQVSRQPTASLSSEDSGQLTVEAKPAISVIPVIGPRAFVP